MDVKNNNKTMKGGFKKLAQSGSKTNPMASGPTRPILSPKPTLVSGGWRVYSTGKPIRGPRPQKGGSSCAKPNQNGGSKSKKTKKAKKSKKPMPKDSAYCLRCQKVTKMLSQKERTTKNGRKQVVGKGDCGHEVFRFI